MESKGNQTVGLLSKYWDMYCMLESVPLWQGPEIGPRAADQNGGGGGGHSQLSHGVK